MEYKTILDKVGVAFLLTAAAYFVAYVFEVSYLRMFGVSWQAARVTLPSLVISFVVMASLSPAFRFLISTTLAAIRVTRKSDIGKFFLKRLLEYVLWFIVLIIISLVVAGGVDILHLAAAALVVPGFKIIELLLDFLQLRGSLKSRLGKGLEVFEKREGEALRSSHFEKIKAVQAYDGVFMVVAVMFSLSYLAGQWAGAIIKPSSAFMSENRQYIVIRNYEGVVIAKELVADKLGERYVIINSSENKLLFYPARINKEATH